MSAIEPTMNRPPSQRLMEALALASQLGASIGAGVLVGVLLDKALGTAPWLTLLMSGAGISIGAWKLLNKSS